MQLCLGLQLWRHPNIVPFVGVGLEPPHFVMVACTFVINLTDCGIRSTSSWPMAQQSPPWCTRGSSLGQTSGIGLFRSRWMRQLAWRTCITRRRAAAFAIPMTGLPKQTRHCEVALRNIFLDEDWNGVV